MAKNYESTTTSSAHNVLASGTIIKGEIFSEENFRIDGQVEGNLSCKGKIVIGPQSLIKGTIDCANIEVFGTIEGNIKCSDTLALRSTAKIKGDISVRILEIEPGAQFDGNSSMLRAGDRTYSEDSES